MAMFSFISQLPGINVGPRMPTFGPMPDKQSPNELFGTLKEGGQLESQPYTGSLEGGYQQKNHCISLSRNWFERQTFGVGSFPIFFSY
jgi:hypothetical protein